MPSQTDEHLLQLLLQGDENALRLLVDRYAYSIYRFAVRFSNDAALAEDISQEVFLRVYRYAFRFDPAQPFRTWLFSIARNVSIDMLRAARFGRLESLNEREDAWPLTPGQNPLESTDPTPEDRVISQETEQAVKTALRALNENQRTAIILKYFEQLTVREIADVLSTTESAVESLLVRAKRNLAKLLSV